MPQHIVARVSVSRAAVKSWRGGEDPIGAGKFWIDRMPDRMCRAFRCIIDITGPTCVQSQYLLFSPCFGEIVRKKSEQPVSGDRFGEILRFLDGAGAGSGSSKAWNIKDFRLSAVWNAGGGFSKTRGTSSSR